MQTCGLPCPGKYLSLLPLTHYLCNNTKKCGPHEEQTKATKIELSDEETANLSDAQFKTLVIRMLTEMIEFGHKIEEEMKAMQSEIKKIYTGNQQ